LANNSCQNKTSYKVGEAASSLTVVMKCRENKQGGSKFIEKKADDVTTAETKLFPSTKKTTLKHIKYSLKMWVSAL
jgi:hypothetical protein